MIASLKRLRGVVGTALTWAAGWFGVGAAGWALGLFPTSLAFAIPTGAVLAVAGAIAGAGFAVTLGITERRRTLTQLSTPRVATWGAIGGLLIAVPMGIGMAPIAYIGTCAFLGLLGAGSAAASISIARAVPEDHLLRGGIDVADQLPAG